MEITTIIGIIIALIIMGFGLRMILKNRPMQHLRWTPSCRSMPIASSRSFRVMSVISCRLNRPSA